MRIFLLILLIGACSLQAQDHLDSLRQVAQGTDQPDSLRLQAGFQLVDTYLSGPTDSLWTYVQAYQDLAKTLGDEFAQGKAWLAQSLYHALVDDSTATWEALRKGVSYCLATDQGEYAARWVMHVAGVYFNRYHFAQTRAFFRYGAEVAASANSPNWEGRHIGNIGFALEQEGQITQSLPYYQQSLEIFQSINDRHTQALALESIGRVYQHIERQDTALAYFQQSLALHQELGDTSSSARLLANIAGIYINQGDFHQTLTRYQKALELLTHIQHLSRTDQVLKTDILKNIGLTYGRQGLGDQGFPYFQRSLALAREIGDSYLIIQGLVTTGNHYQAIGEDSLALASLHEGLSIAQEIGARTQIAMVQTILGPVYISMGDTSLGEQTFLSSLRYYEETDNVWQQLVVLNELALLNLDRKSYRQAAAYSQPALKLAQEVGALIHVSPLADILWQSQQALGQYQAALETYHIHIEARDSLNREENLKSTFEFEYQQQALQDSLAFVEQQAQTELTFERRLAQRNYLLLGGLGLALLAGIFVYFWQQHRLRERELGHQRELLSSSILVQEQERERIAKDLHDEVGSKLGVVNLLLHQIKRTSEQAQESIEDMFSVLGETMQTTRRISHDLLPPTLEAFGLATAIEEFTDQLAQAEGPMIHFDQEGERPAHVDPIVELNLFRILQELLNNTWKYAQAQSVHIHLTQTGESMTLRYQDDGIGFDPNSAGNRKGLGMQNIQSRLQMIQGKLDLKSAPGQGVQVLLVAGTGRET